MKRNGYIRIAIYFVITGLVGTGLHFLYDLSPNVLFAALAPVNESVWEHSKLIVWPMLAAGLIYTRKDKEERGSWYLGILTGWALLMLFGWTVNIRMGIISAPLDIAAYYVILALGFATALWVGASKRWRGVLLLAVGILAALLVVCTFRTPSAILFADLSLADALYTLPC